MASKPVIVVPKFEEEDFLAGLAQFSKPMLEPHFKVILEQELMADPSLFDVVQGIFIMPGITTELLKRETQDKMKNLKVLSSVSAGYNHIDVEHLKSRGVRMGTTPGVLNDATAEMAITLILACARDLKSGLELAMGPKPVVSFGNNTYKQEVTGSTLGIVGMGGIGFEIARRARGLKMTVLYHNRNKRDDDSEVQATFVQSLHDMLPQCDFVAVSCPLNEQTTKLFSAKEFELMKSSAFIINVARGPVVDSYALVDALNNGVIAGAGLDVTDPEPLPRDHPLLQCANATISPHWGSATLRTRKAMFQRALDNMKAVLIGDGNMPSELK